MFDAPFSRDFLYYETPMHDDGPRAKGKLRLTRKLFNFDDVF